MPKQNNTFNIALEKSQKDQRLLIPFYKRNFPAGYIFLSGQSPATMIVQKEIGCDTIVQGGGGSIFIEEKIREASFRQYNDYLIEIKSCSIEGHESLGWVYKSQADYLLYAFKTDPIEIHLMSMRGLRDYIETLDLDRYKKFYNKENNKSENVAIPMNQLQQHINVLIEKTL